MQCQESLPLIMLACCYMCNINGNKLKLTKVEMFPVALYPHTYFFRLLDGQTSTLGDITQETYIFLGKKVGYLDTCHMFAITSLLQQSDLTKKQAKYYTCVFDTGTDKIKFCVNLTRLLNNSQSV